MELVPQQMEQEGLVDFLAQVVLQVELVVLVQKMEQVQVELVVVQQLLLQVLEQQEQEDLFFKIEKN